MRRIFKIFPIVLILLFFSGCSLIGHKEDINGDEPIIPALVQDEDSNKAQEVMSETGDVSETGPASASDSGLEPASSTQEQNETTQMTSGVTSSELLIDNGAGKGPLNNPDNKDRVLLTLYYRNKGGILIPVTRNVVKQEGLAKAAVNGLIDEAVTRESLGYYGLYPVLPKGTKIKGLSIKNQIATVDFSKEFMNFDTKAAEEKGVVSLIYTLTGFKTISEVNIWVEGHPVTKLKNGTDISQMNSRDNTFINSQHTALKEGHIKFDAYYFSNENEKFNYMVPVSLMVEDNEGLVASVFSEMSKKPAEEQLFTSLPEDSKLLSFEKKEDMAVLNFSSQINSYGGGSAKEDSVLKQIYHTISQIKGIKKAKILLDGKESTMAEGTEVAVEKLLPLTFNKVLDE